MTLSDDYREKLLSALASAKASNNPWLIESVTAALEDREATLKLPSIHPEIDELFPSLFPPKP